MAMNIRVIRALHGDCFIISYGVDNEAYILVDGGIGRECYRDLKIFFNDLINNDSYLDLLILTHIDSDHIDNILNLFSHNDFDFSRIKNMWFNYGKFLDEELKVRRNKETDNIILQDISSEISWKQATSLEKILERENFQYKKIIKKYDEFNINNAHITILSPSLDILKDFNKQWIVEQEKETEICGVEDYKYSIKELNTRPFHEKITLSNKSSLAFIIEYKQQRALFLGDSSALEIEKSLIKLGYSAEKPINVDICKISHHASKHNTSSSLIQMLDCKNYIISTNNTANGRPSKECLSRIICNSNHSINFYCNYDIDINRIFSKEEIDKYKMRFIMVEENGINLEDLHK